MDGIFGIVSGTVRHELSSPAGAFHQSVAQRAVAQSDKAQRYLLTDAPRIDMALAAEGERLVAALCAQHQRSRT